MVPLEVVALLMSPEDLPDLFVERPAWMADAACRGVDLGVFFPERGESPRPARALCAGCSVRAECLAYAIEFGLEGIFGGTSPAERRKLSSSGAAAAVTSAVTHATQ